MLTFKQLKTVGQKWRPKDRVFRLIILQSSQITHLEGELNSSSNVAVSCSLPSILGASTSNASSSKMLVFIVLTAAIHHCYHPLAFYYSFHHVLCTVIHGLERLCPHWHSLLCFCGFLSAPQYVFAFHFNCPRHMGIKNPSRMDWIALVNCLRHYPPDHQKHFC